MILTADMPIMPSTDLDYTDDIALLTELMELLLSALEISGAEAAPIGQVVNWKKTKIEIYLLTPIGDLDSGGKQIDAVTSVTYLGIITHSTCMSGQEISKRQVVFQRHGSHLGVQTDTAHQNQTLQCLHCPSFSTLLKSEPWHKPTTTGLTPSTNGV